MTLVLTLRNVANLSDGGPTELRLDRRGAIIGRSPTVDWTLPDPSNYISSRHCEVRFDGGDYQLRDTSTNGTIINGSAMTGPHRLATGDVITIGQYEIAVTAPGAAAPAADPSSNWGGWKEIKSADTAPGAGSDWGKPKPKAPLAGDGLMGGNWAPPHLAPAAAPPQPAAPAPAATGSGWGPTPAPAPMAAATPPPPAPPAWGAPSPGADWQAAAPSAWSAETPAPAPSPAGRDIWGEMAASHSIDWSRSSFGVAATPAAPDPLGLATPSGADALGPLPSPAMPAATPISPPAPAAPPPAAGAPPAASGGSAEAVLEQILPLMGLSRADLRNDPAATLATMATMLRALINGLVVMVEARARAKAQLGTQATILQFDGNNPIKFARTPEQALAQMLNPPERGFMPADRAIEDSFIDLQSHQMATLRAMQGALRATLDRFSPKAISARVESKGLLDQILPGKRDAALWRAYEKEFSGVNQGSDEAFMEVFAKEFRKAYEEEAAKRR